MKSYIHFIRHGITAGIVNRWYYGETDLPLIDEGVIELNKLRSQSIYPDAENASCYTSGMLRANQTFEIIFDRKDYEVISDLREMNFGSWECKTFDELKTLEGFDIWINDKTGTFTFPGGDSSISFQQRVSRGLESLLEKHRARECEEKDRCTKREEGKDGKCDENGKGNKCGKGCENGEGSKYANRGETSSIVVCHGGVIASCMCMLLNEPPETFWEWIPAPGRGYTVCLENGEAVSYRKL